MSTDEGFYLETFWLYLAGLQYVIIPVFEPSTVKLVTSKTFQSKK